MKNLCYFLVSLIFFSACNPKKDEAKERHNFIQYSVVSAFPHDARAFTQGLIIHQGRLFESTGQENSWIAEVDISSGVQTKKVILDPKYFGEGITILNNKIYQLTWQDHVMFIYDFKTFAKVGEFRNEHEGWGITHDNKNLILSDGTHQLYFLDTVTLKSAGSISVTDDGIAQEKLNELEFIDGYVYANQWQTNFILKIDPETGNVVGRMDMTILAEKAIATSSKADVLNGIAWEKKSKLLLVTGKNWPALFAIKLKSDTTKVVRDN